MHALVAAAVLNAAFFADLGKRALDSGAAPGIAIAVVYQGRTVYEDGFGLAEIATRTPVTAGTRFAIGSLTKQLTAAAVAILAEDGKVSFDDRLAKYAPSLPNAEQITLRMLLDQTSGLHNYPFLNEHAWPTQGEISTAQLLKILATDKPNFSPGGRWEYSNTNYAALAAVVEKSGGAPFGSFLNSRIFAPLGMLDSGFGYAAQQNGSVAVGYRNGAPELPALSLDLYSGAGGAISSAHDLALWDSALLRGTLLGKSYLDRVWNESVPTGDGSRRYTMGWEAERDGGHRKLWHNGLAPQAGGYCYNALFPDDGLGVVVLTNGFGAMGMPERIVQSIAAAYGIGAPPAPVAAATVAPGDDPAVDARVRAFWNQLGSGNVDRSALTSDFAALLTPEYLSQVRVGIELLGELRSFTFVGKRQGDNATVYRYLLGFAGGVEHEWDVAVTADGKIAGSRLVR
jgi:CubicO group peptidase (beta-lactamase class C family)